MTSRTPNSVAVASAASRPRSATGWDDRTASPAVRSSHWTIGGLAARSRAAAPWLTAAAETAATTSARRTVRPSPTNASDANRSAVAAALVHGTADTRPAATPAARNRAIRGPSPERKSKGIAPGSARTRACRRHRPGRTDAIAGCRKCETTRGGPSHFLLFCQTPRRRYEDLSARARDPARLVAARGPEHPAHSVRRHRHHGRPALRWRARHAGAEYRPHRPARHPARGRRIAGRPRDGRGQSRHAGAGRDDPAGLLRPP